MFRNGEPYVPLLLFATLATAPRWKSVSGAVGTRITMTGYVLFAQIMSGFIYPVVSGAKERTRKSGKLFTCIKAKKTRYQPSNNRCRSRSPRKICSSHLYGDWEELIRFRPGRLPVSLVLAGIGDRIRSAAHNVKVLSFSGNRKRLNDALWCDSQPGAVY